MTTILRKGFRGTIAGYRPGSSAYRRSLLSMGLTPGEEIHVTGIAPLGDPIEIELRGYNLSLRKAEAEILIFRDNPKGGEL
ncbi:FeoA family protein [Spirochaeta lutea]|uniref:Iron transporter FeoA n=1 Tax=Spirochaeta lutea TaxID=1480694 RepID=A0A098QWU8_9SPIO|nr:FeoA family protein [Spirochaeta lutea]KGE72056.1 iron transporter FeoA [Spirochaeta lutea]